MADGLTAFFSYKTQKICMYQGQCNVYLNTRDSDSEIAMFIRARGGFIFYTHSILKTLENREALRDFFNSSNKRFCFIRTHHYKRTLSNPDFPVYVLAEKRVSSHDIMLLCNKNISRKKKTTDTY
jgi:hypothetical protein